MNPARSSSNAEGVSGMFCIQLGHHLALLIIITWKWGAWLHSWYCATSWKGMGLIPDGVIGIFHWCNPSSHTSPGVDLASNRNEYLEYLMWWLSRNSGGLKLLEL